MFKFARYFFLVFLITTVTPLLLLLFWNHHQMQSFKHKMGEYLLETKINELSSLINKYLEAEQEISSESLNKLNFKQLHTGGPFILEIYKGVKKDENALIKRIYPDFFRKKPPPFIKDKLPPFHKLKSKNKNMPSKQFQLTGTSGEPIALFSISLPVDPGRKFIMQKMISPGYAIFFAGLLLSLLVGLYINNIFVKPLVNISKGTKRIQDGDLSFKLEIQSKQSDIKQTLENFNKMIQDLKEKEELKNSFIENLTHDLRTPLIAQERALELISKEFEQAGMEEQFQLAKGLERNNNHLLRMANLILESYRIDSENIKIKISTINLYELVDNCYEKLKPIAAEKNISLLNYISENFPVIESDLTNLKRVFINLISNSVENIPEGCKVSIRAEEEDEFIRIFIEDNGQGIAPEDMVHIFDRYYSGKSDERKIASGLGLYVCKKILEILNGEISVESEKDKFTRFIVKLPKDSSNAGKSFNS